MSPERSSATAARMILAVVVGIDFVFLREMDQTLQITVP